MVDLRGNILLIVQLVLMPFSYFRELQSNKGKVSKKFERYEVAKSKSN